MHLEETSRRIVALLERDGRFWGDRSTCPRRRSVNAWILATDDEDLLRKVNEIRRIPGVREVELFLHLTTRGARRGG